MIEILQIVRANEGCPPMRLLLNENKKSRLWFTGGQEPMARA
jgi:hypothetical protein